MTIRERDRNLETRRRFAQPSNTRRTPRVRRLSSRARLDVVATAMAIVRFTLHNDDDLLARPRFRSPTRSPARSLQVRVDDSSRRRRPFASPRSASTPPLQPAGARMTRLHALVDPLDTRGSPPDVPAIATIPAMLLGAVMSVPIRRHHPRSP